MGSRNCNQKQYNEELKLLNDDFKNSKKELKYIKSKLNKKIAEITKTSKRFDLLLVEKEINKIDENLTILGLIEIFKLNYV